MNNNTFFSKQVRAQTTIEDPETSRRKRRYKNNKKDECYQAFHLYLCVNRFKHFIQEHFQKSNNVTRLITVLQDCLELYRKQYERHEDIGTDKHIVNEALEKSVDELEENIDSWINQIINSDPNDESLQYLYTDRNNL